MFTRIKYVACLFAPLAVTAGAAFGAAVQFPVADGGTGSSYEVIVSSAITHNAAADMASQAGGHLVSITSAAEQSFIEDLLLNSGAPTGSFWLALKRGGGGGGGNGSGGGGGNGVGFAWETGEQVTFTNFAAGEPNNFAAKENFGSLYWSKDAADDVASRRGAWNDAPESGYPNADNPTFPTPDLATAGYIIERQAVTGPGDGGEKPPVAIPLPAAVFAAPLAAALAGLSMRRARRQI